MDISRQIDDFIRIKHYRQINSVLLHRDGDMIAQCYYNGFTENSRNVIKSVAKSIMSICAGIAFDKGLFKSLDEPICKYIPEFNEYREPLHRAITIRHLLTMTSGIYWVGGVHYHCPMLTQMRISEDWISHIADCATRDMPGTKYNYKEWDVILLAKVLDCICGDMFDYINENLYLPLGIESERWYKSPCGVYYSVAEGNVEADECASSLTALEMLKIGQLFLQNGVWEGQQIISEEYIRQAISPIKSNPGYGMLWWCGDDWYGGRGYGGQSITVVPDKKTIVVTQATPTPRAMSYDEVIWHCVNLVQCKN